MAGKSADEPKESRDHLTDPLPASSQHATATYVVQRIRKINVVRLRLPMMLDSAEFDRLNENLLSELRGHTKELWLLNVEAVAYMGSAMLGLLVNLRQQVAGDNGELALCAMSPGLQKIFQATSLQRLFKICKTLEDGLAYLERAKRS